MRLRTLSNDQTMVLANGVLLWWASYTFKHVLNFNLEGKGLLIDFMQSLKEWLEPEEIIFANDGYGGYYLLNTATDVVLFLDTDDGSKHALLHLKMFLKKLESRG